MRFSDLQLVVDDGEITVTLSDCCSVVYRRSADLRQLVVKPHSVTSLAQSPMTEAEFHAHAWRLARDKARELGWIR